MAWVKFLSDFDWTPPERPTVTLAYKAGEEPLNVTRACAAAAVAHGSAKRVPAPKRGEANAVRVADGSGA